MLNLDLFLKKHFLVSTKPDLRQTRHLRSLELSGAGACGGPSQVLSKRKEATPTAIDSLSMAWFSGGRAQAWPRARLTRTARVVYRLQRY